MTDTEKPSGQNFGPVRCPQEPGMLETTNKGSNSRILLSSFAFLAVLWISSCIAGSAPAQEQPTPPAFPGAEGHGADTPGGRGGRVIEVTNLNDAGPGSFRRAVGAAGRRIVVFRVGGRIRLKTDVNIQDPYLTIAGQTAPGGGVCLSGSGVNIGTHDVIVRYLRSRPGDGEGGSDPISRDGLSVFGGSKAPYNVVVDHSSLSWATDENASTWRAVRDVTFQWNIVSEGLLGSIHPEGRHSMGFLIGAGATRISVHHNLFAHNNQRNPVLQQGTDSEIVNNVVYDWGAFGIQFNGIYVNRKPLYANVVGNHLKTGGDSYDGRKGIFFETVGRGTKVYLKGNVGPGRPADAGGEWLAANTYGDGGSYKAVPSRYRSAIPAAARSGITTQPATEAYDLVLGRAGATLPVRDAVDRRVVRSVRNGTGGIIDSPGQVGGYPAYRNGAPPPDGDHDGMPTTWETRHGFDPGDPSDGSLDADGDGYTNVEEYLNGTMP